MRRPPPLVTPARRKNKHIARYITLLANWPLSDPVRNSG